MCRLLDLDVLAALSEPVNMRDNPATSFPAGQHSVSKNGDESVGENSCTCRAEPINESLVCKEQ